MKFVFSSVKYILIFKKSYLFSEVTKEILNKNTNMKIELTLDVWLRYQTASSADVDVRPTLDVCSDFIAFIQPYRR